MTKQATIYSTKEGMAYQYGNSRTLVRADGTALFQKKVDGAWCICRCSYAHATIDKVKAALA